jgi:hypothetical protein
MTLNINEASNTGTSDNRLSNKRLADYYHNQCAQCGEWLLAPEWSEYRSERCVRHTWSCDACNYAFETDVFFAAAA